MIAFDVIVFFKFGSGMPAKKILPTLRQLTNSSKIIFKVAYHMLLISKNLISRY